MKYKKLAIILSIIFIVFVSVYIFFGLNHNKNNNKQVKLNSSKSKVNIKKIDKTKKIKETEQNHSEDLSNDNKVVDNDRTDSETISNVIVSDSPQSYDNYQNQNNEIKPVDTIQTSANTEPTEWEKLGISEYQYYNEPSPNEGEIAFRDSMEKCESVAIDINNRYSFNTNYGDIYSYSEDYIGCWIIVYIENNNWIFYNEFKQREQSGEFSTRE